MIAALLAALVMQSETEDSLRKSADYMRHAVRMLHEVGQSKDERLKRLEDAIRSQKDAADLVSDLLKQMEDCQACKSGGN